MVCCLGTALNFEHPLRAALCLDASPSHSEGEGVCLVGLPGCGQIHMLVGSGVAPSLGRRGRLLPLHPHPSPLPEGEGTMDSPAHCGLPAEEGT